MNKFSKLAALGCMVATMFLASCGEDSTTPTTTDKNYYPLTVGNSWTYDGAETEDTTGTVREIPESKYTSTTRVDASLTYQGKSAYRMVDSVHNTGEKDTTYISKSSSQLYTYVELIPRDILIGFGIDLPLGSRWVLTSDLNQTSWVIVPDTTIKGIQFDYNGLPLTIDITLKINGAKKETSTMTVDSKSVQVQKYTTTVSVTLSISGIAVPFSIITDTYVSENIGIVKSETHPFTISFPSLLQIPPVSNTGNRETLKTYTVIN